MPTVSIRYIVDDVDAAIAFYCDRLGFEEVMHPAPAFAMLVRGDLRLLLSNPGGAPKPGGWNRFGLEVDDLDATVERLRGEGVRFRTAIADGIGGRQIIAEDPSGNPIELFQPTREEARLAPRSQVLVTGATGKVGRHVVGGLLERDASVRVLARDPDTADLPDGVEVVAGDLKDPSTLAGHLDGVDAVFLVWPFFEADGVAAIVDVLAAPGRRIVYLSAEAAEKRPDSFWAQVESAVERSSSEWTFLRPTGFAANTRMWADQIRDTGVVRWVYGQAARSLIDERDIAAVAVRALTEPGHAAQRYVLTGPETITQTDQVRTIGEAIGRDVRWEELSRDDLGDQLAGVPETALDTWASFVDTPEIVTSTVHDLTGRPARSFAEWAQDHADGFR
jgi:uncharacterized protein YbjT (DUF2867 family)/predicted enzyme related to lactoylglutathione lyase